MVNLAKLYLFLLSLQNDFRQYSKKYTKYITYFVVFSRKNSFFGEIYKSVESRTNIVYGGEYRF